jgi:hypothetical protein
MNRTTGSLGFKGQLLVSARRWIKSPMRGCLPTLFITHLEEPRPKIMSRLPSRSLRVNFMRGSLTLAENSLRDRAALHPMSLCHQAGIVDIALRIITINSSLEIYPKIPFRLSANRDQID